MARRYQFGAVSATFAPPTLAVPPANAACLTFDPPGTAEVPVGHDDRWEAVSARLPEGWQPDFVVLDLASGRIPPGAAILAGGRWCGARRSFSRSPRGDERLAPFWIFWRRYCMPAEGFGCDSKALIDERLALLLERLARPDWPRRGGEGERRAGPWSLTADHGPGAPLFKRA